MEKENNKIQDEITKVLANASVVGLGHLEKNIEKEKKDLALKNREMKRAKEEIEQMEKDLEAMRKGEDDSKVKSEVAQIMTLPIESAQAVGEKTLLFCTKELYNKSDNKLLGKFKIIFEFSEGGIPVRAFNYTQRVREVYDTPHISNGSICWGGTLSPQIRKLILNRDFFYLMELTIDLITTSEKGHPYIPYKDWLEDATPVPEGWEHRDVQNLLDPNNQIITTDEATERVRADRGLLDNLVRQAMRDTTDPVSVAKRMATTLETARHKLEEMREKIGEPLYRLAESGEEHMWYSESPTREDMDFYIWKQIFRPSKDGRPVVMSTSFLNDAIKEYKQLRLYTEHAKEFIRQRERVYMEIFRLIEGEIEIRRIMDEALRHGEGQLTYREASLLMEGHREGQRLENERRSSPYWRMDYGTATSASTTGAMVYGSDVQVTDGSWTYVASPYEALRAPNYNHTHGAATARASSDHGLDAMTRAARISSINEEALRHMFIADEADPEGPSN